MREKRATMWWLWGTLFVSSKNVFKCYNIRKTDDATADMKKIGEKEREWVRMIETIVEPKKRSNIKNSDQFWNDQREVENEKEVEKGSNKE